MGYDVDTSAPATAIGDVAVSGTTARVTFSSEAGARFECSLDNGPFQACTSPRDYTGLSAGSHTVRVRAIDQVGNVGAAVERSFVITSTDTTAPKVRPKPRTVYVSNKGRLKVSLRCPSLRSAAGSCIRIRYRGKTVASKAVTVRGGTSKTVTLKLEAVGAHGAESEQPAARDGGHEGSGRSGELGHNDDQAQAPGVTRTRVHRAAECSNGALGSRNQLPV